MTIQLPNWLLDGNRYKAVKHAVKILEVFYDTEFPITSYAPTGDTIGVDLQGIANGNHRIGVRFRSHEYLEGYPDDFTVRTSPVDGAETELHNLVSGASGLTYYAYGFMAADYSSVVKLSSIVIAHDNPRVAKILAAPSEQRSSAIGAFNVYPLDIAKGLYLVDFTWEKDKGFTYYGRQNQT